MTTTAIKVLGLSLCLSLVGCLNSEDKKTASAEPSSEALPVVMGSVSADKNCSNGKQGTMIYDQAQSQFFFCNDGQWVAVDLRGPKGDKGDTGNNGMNGADGLTGATGANGSNGRDGLDGDGVHVALKENGQVKGILIQYAFTYGKPQAFMMLPNGDTIYIDLISGIFSGSPVRVYYTEENCTGAAYTGRADYAGPNVLGRIYVGSDNSGTPIKYYRAVEYAYSDRAFKSSRGFDTTGQMNNCDTRVSTFSTLVRVEEISAPSSLSHLAPIRFTP